MAEDPYSPYSKGNPSQVMFRLKISGLPGIMLLEPRVLLGYFFRRGGRIYAAWIVRLSKIRDTKLANSRSSWVFRNRK